MKTGTLIIGLVVILLITIPLTLLNIKKNKKKKEFIRKLYDFAKKNNCEISEFDHWGTTLIGIDKTEGKLFYIKNRTDTMVEKMIFLNELQKCRIVNTSRTVKIQNQSNIVTDKLELIFTYYDKNKSDDIIGFYDNAFDGLALTDELLMIDKWEKTINTFVSDKAKNLGYSV